MPATPYTVSVRTLCNFTARAGDLDHRFRPTPTAQEGINGHRTVTARRGPDYVRELPLQGRCGGLVVRGRADGWDPSSRRLEEIKTHRGDLSRVPENHRHLHRAQAETYAHLVCAAEGLDAVRTAVVYFELGAETETPIEHERSAAELADRFAARCARFADWAASEAAHRAARDDALRALRFPMPAFRAGQRELAEAVFRRARDGGTLTLQAPTGIGKTLATLFPALKAMASARLDKIFFLTAKTPGRAVATRALRTLGDGGLPLRVLELASREALCEHPDKSCDGDSCPLARGFHDRLPAARAEAIATPDLSRAHVGAVARAHRICPYHLTHELVHWSDVVVGDYHHWFDAAASLLAATLANEWRVAVLVDEAHNLVDRARAMYTAPLGRGALHEALRVAPAAVQAPLRRLARAWDELVVEAAGRYVVHALPPPPLLEALDAGIAAIGELQAEGTEALPPPLLAFFFAALHLSRMAAGFGPHALFDSQADPSTADATLCVRNVVPAPHLRARFAAAHATVLFSATLTPVAFYRDLLGLPDTAPHLEIASPFASGQLTVRIRSLSTRPPDRVRSAAPIAALIAQQFGAARGNYLAFFSSFDYLALVADALAAQHPAVPHWRQRRRMSEVEQAEFMERFGVEGEGIGFAVLGGRYAEGIDLPGRRLIGAFVATLGLPQLDPVNEQMRRCMEARFGAGFDYGYLYPGLRRVVQAAGRVIRTPSDRGTLYLIDDRYAERRVRQLLPAWWRIEPVSSDGAGRGARLRPSGVDAGCALPEGSGSQ